MPGPEFDRMATPTTSEYVDQLENSTTKKEELASTETSEKPKIATLVFMDLESTGLPSDVGKRNVHITEMCMVAVDRQSFETDNRLRVLNKISLCVRPRFQISPGSMMITGLYNDMLESQEEFDDSVPKLLEYFFRRLQKPICLLAHNGNRFDFPVLQAELRRLNYSLGPDIVCADTLVAFRAICLSEKQAVALEAEENAKKEKACEELVQHVKNGPITDDEIELLLSQDLESFTSIDDALLTEVTSTKSSPQIYTPGKELIFNEILSPSQNEKTPQKTDTASNLNGKPNGRKRKVLDPTYLPKHQYQYNKKKNIPAKRNLFPEQDQRSLEIHKITKFSLENLYNHFFHESPDNSHYAEVDCMSLSKVCQKVSKSFLKWVDENSVTFSSIDALW